MMTDMVKGNPEATARSPVRVGSCVDSCATRVRERRPDVPSHREQRNFLAGDLFGQISLLPGSIGRKVVSVTNIR